ncbi:hypothetical protein K493DRAFT_299886 [Basidiobolus meristosporus CBS 931.73]|uniref:GH18 domain-containing protein n=1 Tax=Basidiobolus meristosporus CBS 931.73 TaxID=1314790 RepID=A0A1Y1YKC1_9FUNG|nr:hypothetical protein K493DRAFT_299886 [Basidiobolus meristosporus CBS 931.73]|eukprot:ORX98455.1 hypothetical protein K493DRAFT_299886 [Basidiobolus meristosporus CBS 931.73]
MKEHSILAPRNGNDTLQSGPTTPVNGWSRYWNNTTRTPWLFRANDKQFISYDDPQSLKIKVDYTRQSGLRGVECTGWGCPLPTAPSDPTSTVQPTSTVTSKTSTIPSVASSSFTTSGSPSPTSGLGNCSAATVYNGAQTVVYKSHLWQAKWWSSNDTPVSDSQNVGTGLGAC